MSPVACTSNNPWACENFLYVFKTLAHELAHELANELANAILHEGEANRALAELEAESVAFVVCGALGIDTSEYSFGYVSS